MSNLDSPIGCLVGVYGIASQIMSLIFFVEYCRADSLLSIIFIDTWLSELKGLLWPFFIGSVM